MQKDSFLILLRPKWWKTWVFPLPKVPRTLLWGTLPPECLYTIRQTVASALVSFWLIQDIWPPYVRTVFCVPSSVSGGHVLSVGDLAAQEIKLMRNNYSGKSCSWAVLALGSNYRQTVFCLYKKIFKLANIQPKLLNIPLLLYYYLFNLAVINLEIPDNLLCWFTITAAIFWRSKTCYL